MNRLWWLALVLMGWGGAPGFAAAANGNCTTAVVGEPLGLPDGSIYPAGKLTLCVGHDYSPVKSMHAVYVDRRPVAMLMSSRGLSEGQHGPFMMFHRNADGRLILYGYAVPYRELTLTYWLERPRRNLGRVPSSPGKENGVQVAANMD